MADFSEQQIKSQMSKGLSREGAIANLMTQQEQGNLKSPQATQTAAIISKEASLDLGQVNTFKTQVGTGSTRSRTTITPRKTTIGGEGLMFQTRDSAGNITSSRYDSARTTTNADYLYRQAMAQYQANPTRYAKPYMQDGRVVIPSAASPEPTPVQKVEIKPPSADRPLSGSEYEQARTTLGAYAGNFDQFFTRDGGGNIYLKKDAAQELQEKMDLQQKGGVSQAGLTAPLKTPGERLLGPTEFKRLREQFGASEANFDEFFRRDELGNIYLKEGAFSKSPEKIFSAALPETQVNEFSSSILDESPLTFPDTPELDYESFVTSMKSLYEKTETERQRQLEANQERLTKLYEEQITKFGEFPDRLESLRSEFEVKKKFDAIEEASLEVQKLNAEFDDLIFRINDQEIPISIIRGQEAKAIEKKALVIGAKNGVLQAMMGNLDLANQLIQQTIDLEFGSLEAQVAGTADLLNINRERLGAEESKQANIIQETLRFRERAIQERKEEKEFIKNLMLEVASIGGSPQNISLDKTLEENLSAYSAEMRKYNDEQERKAKDQLKSNVNKQLIKNDSGVPVGVFNPATGDIEKISSPGSGDYVGSIGQITGYGSPLWEYGLDVDVEMGQPLFSASDGLVVDVLTTEESGGFGNQVQIMDNFGNTIWYSHLMTPNVQIGQSVGAGEIIGLGGNTGNVLTSSGVTPSAAEIQQGAGSHVDLTIVDANGNYLSARDVESYLNQSYAREGKTQDDLFSPETPGVTGETMFISVVDGTPAELNTAEQDALASTYETIKQIDDMLYLMQKEGSQVSTGFLAGRTFEAKKFTPEEIGNIPEDMLKFDFLAQTLFASYLKAMSGTAVSDTEREMYQKFLPSSKQQEYTNITGLQQLRNLMLTKQTLKKQALAVEENPNFVSPSEQVSSTSVSTQSVNDPTDPMFEAYLNELGL